MPARRSLGVFMRARWLVLAAALVWAVAACNRDEPTASPPATSDTADTADTAAWQWERIVESHTRPLRGRSDRRRGGLVRGDRVALVRSPDPGRRHLAHDARAALPSGAAAPSRPDLPREAPTRGPGGTTRRLLVLLSRDAAGPRAAHRGPRPRPDASRPAGTARNAHDGRRRRSGRRRASDARHRDWRAHPRRAASGFAGTARPSVRSRAANGRSRSRARTTSR